jgi:hypothetical protein
MKKLLIVLAGALLATSCTDNNRVKNYGGTMTVNLPKGQKLVIATWKEESIWYLTRPMEANEQPVESHFQEKSAKGLVEGKVIIKESK